MLFNLQSSIYLLTSTVVSNLERMIALANEFFDWKNDPGQIAVDESVLKRLKQIHPATLNEEIDGDGPVAWILVIPTTRLVMEKFLAGSLNEQQLLDATQSGEQYEAIYLCSALVLPEFRGKGIAKRLTLQAIEEMRKGHPVSALYYWAFSPEGKSLAEAVAAQTSLPLFLKTK